MFLVVVRFVVKLFGGAGVVIKVTPSFGDYGQIVVVVRGIVL